MLTFSSHAFACGEGYTSVTVDFSGNVKSGDIYKHIISPDYYFATNALGMQVKVNAQREVKPISFWLLPDKRGWRISVGDKKNLNPDYIQVIGWNKAETLLLNDENVPHEFCFTVDNQNYEHMLEELNARVRVKGSMADMLYNLCKKKDESIGMGVFTLDSVTSWQVNFSVDLKIPVYTTDCPPPANE